MHARLRSLLALVLILGGTRAWAEGAATPTTPIEHLVVIVGENLSFDHLFATFRPAAGETIANLLAKGIVTTEGEPGPNFARGADYARNRAEHRAGDARLKGAAVRARSGK